MEGRRWREAEEERMKTRHATLKRKKKGASKSIRCREIVSGEKACRPDSIDSGDALLGILIECAMRSLRGKRVYAWDFADYVDRFGTTSSTGGARGHISRILSQVGGYLSV